MKALASDFDNTLCFNHNEFRESDLKAIKDFQYNGNKFGVCTGRCYEAIIMSTHGALKYDFFLVNSGSMICDNNGDILFDQPLDYQTIYEIIQNNYRRAETIGIQANKDGYFAKVEKEDLIFRDGITFNDIEKMTIYGCSVLYDPNKQELIDHDQQVVENSFPNISTFRNTRSYDVIAKGCSKGDSIKKYKEMAHIDLIGAIGDYYNDITMLKAADVSFTFENAPQEVKDSATYIVNSIAQALEIMDKLTI